MSEYLLWFWDTPLIIWEGYLADYGALFLWTYYLYEHYAFGKQHKYNGLIWDVTHEQANGIQGWKNVLKAHKIWRSFDQIFQDWCIANYLDDKSIDHGRYGYYNLDLPSENSYSNSVGVEPNKPLVMEIWADWHAGTGYFDWFVDKYPYQGEVSFIQTTAYSTRFYTWTWNYISNMRLNDNTEQGKKYFTCFDGKKWDNIIVMVAFNQPGYEHTFGTWYSFNAHPRHWPHHWWC